MAGGSQHEEYIDMEPVPPTHGSDLCSMRGHTPASGTRFAADSPDVDDGILDRGEGHKGQALSAHPSHEKDTLHPTLT